MLDSTTAFEVPEGFRAPPPVPDKVTGNGNGDAIIGPGRGPHRASLSCRFCNVHRGWLNKQTAAFLLETIKQFGRPTVPITIPTSVRSDLGVRNPQPSPNN